jgi:predicted outer membrane protein
MKTSVGAGEKAAASYFQDSVGNVQLGRLRVQRARDPAVRSLAPAMVRDHTRTAAAGMQVAGAIGDDAAQLDSTLIGAHMADIGAARDALESATSPALRAYLTSAIAVDQRHLRMAQAAQYRAGKEK